MIQCTVTSKINVIHKGVFLPILKLNLILAVANLLAHNNKSQICYCGQDSLQSTTVNCSFSDNLTPLGVTFILLAMLHLIKNFTYMNMNRLMHSTTMYFMAA